ncbi:thioredoxin family protein [Williamwhitmania taraxaci]|uniref:Thioredoxin n=1 Tax=Williamwhitmania taraxaci TaxID=1640674 RepID=A0A1G6GU21_9BACT|nr:thioredoxin family protein [Williamwhitmania taraxaci]SDB84626.1 Thioredoxin [Williamwhitmania taraxaci]
MEKIQTKVDIEFFTRQEACLVYLTTDDCGACGALLPKIESMAKEFPLLNAYHIALPQHPELAAPMAVYSAPTVIIYFDGKEQIRKSGRFSIDEIRIPLERIYNLYFIG